VTWCAATRCEEYLVLKRLEASYRRRVHNDLLLAIPERVSHIFSIDDPLSFRVPCLALFVIEGLHRLRK
jgi:hypothetical protein